MKRIEARRHLHLLRIVDGLAIRHVHARLLERGTSVRETVLDHEILRLLGIDERRDKGLLGGDDRSHALDAGRRQLLLDHRMRTRRDLVDHRPRERDDRLVRQIIEIRLRRKSVRNPGRGHLDDGRLELLAIVRAVVHRHDRHRQLSRMEALKQQRRDNRHRVTARLGAFLHVGLDDRHQRAVGTAQLIALLGNREGQHLKGRRTEDALELGLRRGIREIRLHAPRDARQDLLGDRAIRIEEHVQRQVVERGIDLIDDIVVEGVACDDAGLRQTCLEQTLTQRTDKAAEDVARAEMDPLRRLFGLRAHGGDVKGRQLDLRLFPGLGIRDDRLKTQLHRRLPFCLGYSHYNTGEVKI